MAAALVATLDEWVFVAFACTFLRHVVSLCARFCVREFVCAVSLCVRAFLQAQTHARRVLACVLCVRAYSHTTCIRVRVHLLYSALCVCVLVMDR